MTVSTRHCDYITQHLESKHFSMTVKHKS